MLTSLGVPWILLAVAAIFFALVLLDLRRSREGAANPARKTWLRVAVIFSAVAIGLMLINALSVSP